MSLHHLAKDMQSKGRNGDSVLVHMSPGEVHGLQALALAHGGSLTINPETGLPEASFLSSLLPTILGAGLAMTGIGAPMAALMVGGGYGLAKGSLKEGLMAGLGAYGGAGLGAGLAASAPTSVLPGTSSALGSSAVPGALNPATSIAATTAPAAAVPGAASTFTPLTGAPTSGMLAGGNANTLANAYGAAANPAGFVPMDGVLANTGANVNTMANAQGLAAAGVPAHTPLTSAVNVPSTFDQAIAGAKATYGGGMEGLKALYGNLPTGTMPALGLTLAQAMQQEKLNAPPVDKGMIRPYTLDRQQNQAAYDQQGGYAAPAYGQPFDSSERMFFNDTFTAGKPYKAPGPEYAANGGLMGLNAFDEGGAVENMSNMNAIGANTNYPMANIQSHAYSNPMSQYPANTNVLAPSADAGVDTYTGSPTFAEGGSTSSKYSFNPQTQQFTQTNTATPAAGSFSGLGGLGSARVGSMNPQGDGMIARLLRQMPQQQPTTTTQVSGGVAAPYMPTNQQQQMPQYAQPMNMPAYQSPTQQLGLDGFYDYMNQQMGDMQSQGYANGGMTDGHLGGYSDGGRLLKGPGDGVSDSIPASIGNRQPARLADGEFVIPARIVSELGNGSTEAGARRLYAMMDRVQNSRKKSIGKGKVAVNSKADKHLPA